MELTESWKNELNPHQLEAVNTLEGPLLILAGAGSGKTRVLTFRVANLIVQGLASPCEILAVTFTNKAAREMEARIYQILSQMGIPVYEPMWINTFHATCVRILREHIHLLGYKPFFGIYDDSDQLSMIKKVLNALNIDDKMYPPKSFQGRINDAKRRAWAPEDVDPQFMDEKSLQVYQRYEQEMQKANSLDFGDLLFKTYDLFQKYPDILERYQKQFSYILVDEYQDTNHIQYRLTKMLASHKNICVVGDEDQSIYSWRGADIENILSFENDFPGCKTVKLEQNYRSTQTIVEAASEMIQNNSQRKNKALYASNTTGEQIHVHEVQSEYEEARHVVRTLSSLPNTSYRETAVFYRTNAQSRVLEDLLRSHSIPYRIVGGVKFYERKEVKDLLAYLKLILNPADDVALKRIINIPTRGIGKTTVQRVEQAAESQGLSFYEAVLYAKDNKLVNTGAARKLQTFRETMDRICSRAQDLKASEIYHMVLDETEYVTKLKEDSSSESKNRIENLEELDNAIQQFEQERGEEASLQSFLEEMALVSDVDRVEDDNDYVTLMTLHLSKGLEFPVVFIVGMEEGLFPSARTFSSSDPTAVEEERRLAYVGMTRAKEKLFLTHARSRRVWGQEQQHPPSRFLEELPEKYLKKTSALYQPGFMQRSRRGPQGAFQYDRQSHQVQFDSFPDYENFADEDYSSEKAGYSKGMRVRHPTFGVGKICQIEGSGDTQKVSVMFANKTLKKFVAKYARLEQVP